VEVKHYSLTTWMSELGNCQLEYFRAVSMIALLVLLAACVILPVPPHGRTIGEEDLQKTLKLHSSTKEDVLEVLGEPNVLHHERFFVYRMVRYPWGIALISSYPFYSTIPLGEDTTSNVLIQFDEKGTVTNYRAETGDRIRGEQSTAHRQTWINPDAPDPEFRSVAFSPDGKLLAIGHRDNQVMLWNLETGQKSVWEGERSCEGGASCAVGSVVFAPDGKTLAAAGMDYAVGIWDVTTGKRLVTLEGDFETAWFAPGRGNLYSAFSPDGKTVATGDGLGQLHLSDVATGRNLITKFDGSSRSISAVVYSPDGKMIVTAKITSVTFWDAETGKELARLERESSIRAVAFSPDGQWLALASWFHVELWRVRPQPERTVLRETKGGDTWLPILDDIVGVFILPIIPHELAQASIAFSPDGKALAAIKGSAILWDVATSTELWRFELEDPQSPSISDLAFSPDGKTLATATNDGVDLWRIPR